MNILFVSSEAEPFIKTGGLGDVSGTLSIKLAAAGHRVSLVLPFYRNIRENSTKFNIKNRNVNLAVQMGDVTHEAAVWVSNPLDNLSVYFIEYNDFFNRNDLYGENGQAYLDNNKRFAFLCKAALELSIDQKLKIDIVHANDWQTALLSYYLKTWYWSEPSFQRTASVLTIHNIAYQGRSNLNDTKYIGLNWMQVRSDEFEDQGGINLLKGGIFYSDSVTTVSPTYAKEILSEPGGNGLSSFLKRRSSDVIGILNGINESEWNCQTDPFIPANFSVKDLKGKSVCKTALRARFNLNDDKSIPVFGMVGRMTYQKGLQLLMDCAKEILQWDLQLIILGSGESYYTDFFNRLANEYPHKVGVYIGFENELAHLIEAGSDFFVMPSLFEPCGLNQIYSMLYGTLPIVRNTGGLSDTVQNFDEKKEIGTGFVFDDSTSEALKNTIGWALSTWYNNKKAYKKLQTSAMNQYFGWDKAVENYNEVYQKALDRKRHWT